MMVKIKVLLGLFAFMLIPILLIGCGQDKSETKSEPMTQTHQDQQQQNKKATDEQTVKKNDQPKESMASEQSESKPKEDTKDTKEQKTTQQSTQENQKTTQDQSQQPTDKKPVTTSKSKSATSTNTSTTKSKEVDKKAPEEPSKSTVQSTQKSSSPAPVKNKVTKSVSLTIVGDKKMGTFVNKANVPINEKMTLITATVKYLKEKHIQYSVTGSGSSTYVEGINNLYEFDHGPMSGWMVKKNGTLLSRSSGAVTVSNGDSITWIYTENYRTDQDVKK
ncbi:DUF4430 domain-containing protein [Terrilactibacillus laevilacticus]|nr:DUF4430 domain-containing protein [Terrilactibacillus laevilacticus]